MELEGAEELLSRLKRLGEAGEPAVKRQAGLEARWVLEQVRGLVPVRTGWLRRSGRVREWKRGWNVIFDAPHAYLIHEGKFEHPSQGELIYKKSGGQKHYVQQPLELLLKNGVFDRYQAAFNEVIEEVMGGS